MPNWCEGQLKVRGSYESLRKFLFEGLKPVDFLGFDTEPLSQEKCSNDPEFSEKHSEWIINIDSIKEHLHMKGTVRNFCQPDWIYITFKEKDEVQTLVMPFKAAWNIDAKPWAVLSKEFGIDLKIDAFEEGGQFSRTIEVVNGIIRNDATGQYENWYWDAVCPITFG